MWILYVAKMEKNPGKKKSKINPDFLDGQKELDIFKNAKVTSIRSLCLLKKKSKKLISHKYGAKKKIP